MKINWQHWAMVGAGGVVALCGYLDTADPSHVSIYKTVGAVALAVAGMFGASSPSIRVPS